MEKYRILEEETWRQNKVKVKQITKEQREELLEEGRRTGR